MITLWTNFWHAMLYDENAVRRWARGAISTVSVGGAVYADQLEPYIGHGPAQAVRLLAILATIAAAIHGDPVEKP